MGLRWTGERDCRGLRTFLRGVSGLVKKPIDCTVGEQDCRGLRKILSRGEQAGEKNPRLLYHTTVEPLSLNILECLQ